MPKIGSYYFIPPQDWLFPTNGDVLEAKKRAKYWFDQKGTFVVTDSAHRWPAG
jgi:type I restriction enzyme M protein